MTAQFDEIKKTHNALMTEYVKSLNEISKLPFFIDADVLRAQPSVRRGFKSRFLTQTYNLILDFYFKFNTVVFKFVSIRYFVHVFVEAHIKHKLKELKTAYTQLSQSLPDDDSNTAEFALWLKKSKDTCNEFSETLFSWTSVPGLITALGPFGLSVFISKFATTIYEKITSPPPNAGALAPLEGAIQAIQQNDRYYLIIPIILLYSLPLLMYIWSNFVCKRLILLRSGNDYVMPRNVYEMEDKLFSALDRGKSHEFPVDLLAMIIFLIVFAYLITERQWTVLAALIAQAENFRISLLDIYRRDSGLLVPMIESIPFLLAVFIIIVSILIQMRRRKWR